jgi:uncharacterized protein YdhG (YjbR/CyaY superfamily)
MNIKEQVGVEMENEKKKYISIDEYVKCFPLETQKKLEELRAAIKMIVPDAEEKISYQMPTFTLNGNLVYFAAYKNHIGFYPTSSGIEAFKHEIKAYKSAKGTVQFPLDKPLPIDLISRIVKYRVEENLKKPTRKTNKSISGST